MAIPVYYGGIDKVYGDVSVDSADKILDIVDDYIELIEKVEVNNNADGER